MPRRRRKYRRPRKEQEKPEGPFFARSREEAPVSGLLEGKGERAASKRREVKGRERGIDAGAKIEPVRKAVLGVLHAVECAIADSQPDQALVNQSRALELANKMLAADIWDISVLQQAVKRIAKTVGEGQFFCGNQIGYHYGRKGSLINLGYGFKQHGFGEQVYAMLKATVRQSELPELYGMPVGGYEHTDPACAWTEYLCLLLNSLPDRPLLITGTVPDWLPPQPEEVEEGAGGIISTGLRSLRSFLRGRPRTETDTGSATTEETLETGEFQALNELEELGRRRGLLPRIRGWFDRRN